MTLSEVKANKTVISLYVKQSNIKQAYFFYNLSGILNFSVIDKNLACD